MIRDFGTLVESLPDSLDFTMMPHLPEEVPPIIRCGDRSVAEAAASRLKVG